ncbi:unnamed protein product [Staurois parvus]|uniref:Rho-GAP domain-containing protein n=1 Tax=Staurois parvus TaxID=386267 RepID=A0ABN9DLL6_9NEOB|nr:unnamed protein product [Staurois parvus]
MRTHTEFFFFFFFFLVVVWFVCFFGRGFFGKHACLVIHVIIHSQPTLRFLFLSSIIVFFFQGKIFGAPILSLPQLFIPEYGSIPTFLVDVCKYLESHAHTEGLFRKSGSVVRQKLLKAKLDGGDSDLMDALPCDVAGILKQFFRELPEPILPADLQDVLCKAQQLSHDEKTSATILISCLMHERAVSILRYFFNFLQNVSMRSDTNRMNSSNLAVIFAPNLLQTGDSEKISSSTEKKLRVQAAIVQTLIDQASDIGEI